MQKNKRYPKISIVDEEALTRAEHHNCKAAALTAGASKILNDFVGGVHWAGDINLEVAIDLLNDAKAQSQMARRQYEAANNKKRERK